MPKLTAGNQTTAVLMVGPQGRVVIPAAIRKRLNISQGSRLLVTVSDGEIRLRASSEVLDSLQARFARAGKGSLLSTELIANRRREAKQNANYDQDHLLRT